MELLIFAHRPEAGYFIESDHWLPSPDLPFPLLKHKASDTALLITGEGIEKSILATSSVLSCEKNITSAINLGVAGHLQDSSEKLQREEIYPIRTVYAETSNARLQSKSFTLQVSGDSQIPSQDCLSVCQRVLDDKKAQSLSHFSPIVDRELWGIAMVCNKFQVPLRSYKLISDIAGQQTQCLDIRNQAQRYSRLLYEKYQTLLDNSTKKGPLLQRGMKPINELPNTFHSTRSQQDTLSKLITTLNIKEEGNSNFFALQVQSLARKKLTPKQRTSELIKNLQDHLNPFTRGLKKKLESHIENFERDKNIHLHFTKNFESEEFNISLHIENSRQFHETLNEMKSLDVQGIQDILLGEGDHLV